MGAGALGGQASEVRLRLDELERRAEREADGPLLPDALEELRVSVEELRVSEEELSERTDRLADSRRDLERERWSYRELFDLAPDAYLVTDPRAIIRDANLAACELLGARPGRLTGKPLAIYVARADLRTFRRRVAALEGAPTLRGWELRLQPRVGEPVRVEASVAWGRGPDGVASLRWILRGVAGRDAVREALLASEARTRALLGRVSERVLVIGPDGAIRYHGPASKDEAVPDGVTDPPADHGRDLRDLIHPGDHARLIRVLKEELADPGAEATCNLRLRAARGSPRLCEARFHNPGDSAAGGLVVVLRDVTEQRALERRLVDAVAAERGRLAQDLHDGLGNRLSAIHLLASLMSRRAAGADSPAAEDAAQLAALASEALAAGRRITGDFHRPELHPLDFGRDLANLAGLAESVYGIRCACDAPPAAATPSDEAAQALYRVAQEAIDLAARRAGATAVHLLLDASDAALRLEIVADGAPLDTLEGDAGVETIRCSARLIGASVEFARCARGSRIVIRVSLPRASHHT